MARVKRGLVSKRRHNKLLKSAKGYRGTKRRLVKVAREAVLHAGVYAYAGRKNRKRDMRALWILRINEALKEKGLKYNVFIKSLADNNIKLDRKTLAHIVASDPDTFNKITEKVFDKTKKTSVQ